MYVIYRDASIPEPRRIEFNLIEHARMLSDDVSLSQNRTSGGGYFRPRSPCFVYSLQKKC